MKPLLERVRERYAEIGISLLPDPILMRILCEEIEKHVLEVIRTGEALKKE